MKYDDLKNVIREVLKEEDPWKKFLDQTRDKKQVKMVPRSAPPEPKREPELPHKEPRTRHVLIGVEIKKEKRKRQLNSRSLSLSHT